MAKLYAETYYSFRNGGRIFDAVVAVDAPDQMVLAAIDAKMTEADTAFHARRYRDAIVAYKAAQSLIYAQLNPRHRVTGLDDAIAYPLDQRLFEPLLSASLEWFNVLPIDEPLPGVRPRSPVDPALLGEPSKLDSIGLQGRTLGTRGAIDAAADWRLAKVFTEQGNAGAAKFFLDRARATDPKTVKELETGQAPTHGLTPRPVGAPPDARPAAPPENGGRIGRLAPSAVRLSRALTASLVEVKPTMPSALRQQRSYGALVRGNVVSFAWDASVAPPLAQLRASVYEQRIALKTLPDALLRPKSSADYALALPHLYYYVIPLALAESYHALGDYALAESLYFQAASYQYLNAAIEAPYVFLRLTIFYLDWGNSLFQAEEDAQALDVYEHAVRADRTAPNSRLYTQASLKPGADAARLVLQHLDDPSAANVNPDLAATLVDIWRQLTKLSAGLDFWGHRSTSIPIWTFEYLQQAAISFTQLAISAERDVISYWERADLGELTRLQLEQSKVQAAAEAHAAQLQADATKAEVAVYQDGLALAQARQQNAIDQANEYANLSRQWIMHQALSTQLSGGDDGDASQLNRLADRMLSGPYSISGDRGTLAAAEQLSSSRLQRQYELDSLNRQAQEMGLAAVQAQSELKAANARASAAQAGADAAALRSTSAQATLDAFDAQTFTPDVWYRMGQVMWRLYQRYLGMAVDVAKLMQRAYNFETDQSLKLIKSNYSTGEVKGLLGADTLMADIQSFTYHLITSQKSKAQPIRQTISLAGRYPFAFEKQLRPTGVMEFETRIDDFDLVYPGTYAGRIEAVEVSVEGIVPASGVSGTLTNSGISGYRVPAALWNAGSSGLKYRVQPKESLVISDYTPRQDALMIPPDQRQLKIFEGAGVVSTWVLELPKAVNDIDYGALTDVKLTFSYRARFDPTLRDQVLVDLATHPGLNARQRGVPLRWLYPDAFFHFQDTGELSITLRPSDFRNNETLPELIDIGILVATDGTVPAAGLTVSLSTPTQPAVTATTDGSGILSSEAGPWTALAHGTALGTYVLTLSAANNPGLVHGGVLDLKPIVNIALMLGYTFTARA